MADLKNTSIDGTVFRLPVGDTGARPSGVPGSFRFNNETNSIEKFERNSWLKIDTPQGSEGSGGDTVNDFVIDGVSYRSHIFTSLGSSTFTVLTKGLFEVLLVAGGGATGYDNYANGGGGGAGGLQLFRINLAEGDYAVYVGDGGQPNQERGENSRFGNYYVTGGGLGGSYLGLSRFGQDGGSGGGGRGGSANFPSGKGNLGNKQPVEGHKGGPQNGTPSGGGGAGGPALSGVAGPGIETDITGTLQYYAGGGNGADESVTSLGRTPRNNNGAPNTGAGAGASGDRNYEDGYVGGSGIVVVRYIF